MANFILGMDGVLYRSATLLTLQTVAHVEGKTWIEVGNVRDVTVNTEKGEADFTARDNDGWRAVTGTLKQMTLEFEMVWRDNDQSFEAIKDAFLNNTEIALAAMTGVITVAASEGPVANFSITNFSREEPLEDVIKAKVTAKATSKQQWFVKPS